MTLEFDCRKMYEETENFYKKNRRQMGQHALGYRVLYGPPVKKPKIMFLGIQPGTNGMKEECDKTWPDEFEFLKGEYRLANKVRKNFCLDFLKDCNMSNLNFFRARRAKNWREIDKNLRDEMEVFSKKHCEKLIRDMQPEQIIIIGLNAFDSVVEDGKEDLVGETSKGKKVVLAKTGILWDSPATGIIHLTGARINTENQEKLKEYLTRFY